MACCIIAAFLVAQAVAMLRRWGIFWGVVRARADEDGETVFQRIGQWLRKPVVRAAVTGIAAVELAALGVWIYAEHGTHLYQIADQTAGRLRGERIIYAEQCTPTGNTTAAIRVVIAANGATRSSVSYQ